MTDRFTASDPVRRRLRRLSRGERLDEAIAFLRQFARENDVAPTALRDRERAVRAAVRRHGHYVHTAQELAFGARLAWRNHAQCSGRLTWKSLRVVDRRDVRDPEAILARTLDDLAAAVGDGRIRASISIFAPATETTLPATFDSVQLFQYAGYARPDGSVLGDRAGIEPTRTAERLGWRRPDVPGAFDLLPVTIRDERGARHAFELPAATAREVTIAHPTLPGLRDLGLRWYGVPSVTNMVLSIGGIDYPCAPFNGHYVATEIASRNLTDAGRYDLLEPVARALGIAVGDGSRSLWRDTALTELNRAVLHSFDRDGIRIADHHEVSAQHMEFARQEQRAGRAVSGEWSWVVPPQASAACPTFHLPMRNLHAVPNFYHTRASGGGALRIDRTYLRDGKWTHRWERMKRRVRDWRRRRDHLWQR
ncbi:hypothetical protein ASG29_03945 [Sphingomonas sp. Leaf412]|uniref:nitric oxide synthase oxygenase n=1 Tax=Sphingomonas sp. Leaf412 TaxID=1736370 RepID=UPI0007004EDE|nr:nitric oxide synthase oxygenase [Sphingomonas sp. Leaf412]KQT35266.1 hypothetical protein ASG29_03945 [Sphingomonas sp. Leaf412]